MEARTRKPSAKDGFLCTRSLTHILTIGHQRAIASITFTRHFDEGNGQFLRLDMQFLRQDLSYAFHSAALLFHGAARQHCDLHMCHKSSARQPADAGCASETCYFASSYPAKK